MPTLNRYSHSAFRSSRSSPNLKYNGGPVETNTTVTSTSWGSDWNNTSFSQSAGGYKYTYSAAMNYIQTFFKNVGGSNWIKTDNQYCMSSGTVTVPTGTTNCAAYPSATFITNSGDTFGGAWIDSS